MPSAALPDLNTGYITYRKRALDKLDSKKYGRCIGALYAWNGMLPEQYQVTVSTIEYQKATMQKPTVTCTSCDNKTDYDSIQIRDMIVPLIDNIISGQETEKVWLCEKCEHLNKLTKTDVFKPSAKEPHFLKIVPKPPEYKDSIMDRIYYHKKMQDWVELFIAELEHQMGKYRVE